LAHGIAEGQLFIERNKRVALAALHTFLLVNGLQIDASQEERARWILTLAVPGRTAEEKVRDLAARLRRSTSRIQMRLMKARGEEESVHFSGERLLDVG
jgi:death on curing protein